MPVNGNMNDVAAANRLHIALFGCRNAGKSSLLNAVTGQALAVVSEVKGTTTDPVYKAMELLPLGPVVLIDTPGFDDEGSLGRMRVQKALEILRRADIAVLVADVTAGLGDADRLLLELFEREHMPRLLVWNKMDLAGDAAAPPFVQGGAMSLPEIRVSAKTGLGIEALKQLLGTLAPKEDPGHSLTGGIIKQGQLALLVVPIDKAAPKGRLIMPQQMAIRSILDAGGTALVTRDSELQDTLMRLSRDPDLVITDSQVFRYVSRIIPERIPLTSFSILMARYKGFLASALQSAKALQTLRDGDVILMAEGCTHHRQCGDIGTVKLPAALRKYSGKDLLFRTSSGRDFPADLSPYAAVIHCGGCMLNERELSYRRKCAAAQGIPFLNYGTALAHINGILARSTAMFPEYRAAADPPPAGSGEGVDAGESLPLGGKPADTHSPPAAGKSAEAHSLPTAGQSAEAHSLPAAGKPADTHSPPAAGQPAEARALSLAEKLAEAHSLSLPEYEFLIAARTPELAGRLKELAVRTRKAIYGNSVYIRGLIEISSFCKNDCLYCGLRRSNRGASRYRLSEEEILSSAEKGYALGFRTFVLQGGEDSFFTDERLTTIIRGIKAAHKDTAVTLSLGERSRASYARLFAAGADRYLLRHETASPRHYKSLHAADQSFARRMNCLRELKEIGYAVGTGFMVGSPGQTPHELATDLKFIETFRPDMCGIGPFVPHHETPFAGEKAGSAELTCFLLSLIRLIYPPVLLPATTALGTIDREGREKGILAGANVIMPNLSPPGVRKQYALYDGKICTGEEAAECIACLKKRMESIGYTITIERGDRKEWLPTTPNP